MLHSHSGSLSHSYTHILYIHTDKYTVTVINKNVSCVMFLFYWYYNGKNAPPTCHLKSNLTPDESAVLLISNGWSCNGHFTTLLQQITLDILPPELLVDTVSILNWIWLFIGDTLNCLVYLPQTTVPFNTSTASVLQFALGQYQISARTPHNYMKADFV